MLSSASGCSSYVSGNAQFCKRMLISARQPSTLYLMLTLEVEPLPFSESVNPPTVTVIVVFQCTWLDRFAAIRADRITSECYFFILSKVQDIFLLVSAILLPIYTKNNVLSSLCAGLVRPRIPVILFHYVHKIDSVSWTAPRIFSR